LCVEIVNRRPRFTLATGGTVPSPAERAGQHRVAPRLVPVGRIGKGPAAVEHTNPMIDQPPWQGSAMSGAAYSLVLTHDIDAPTLVELPAGRTLAGFFYRCLAENVVRFIRGHVSLEQYLRSISAVVEYFKAKCGHGLDPWAKSLGIMLDMERSHEVRSTLFFIPLCGEPGVMPSNLEVSAPRNRAAHYRLDEYREVLEELVRGGWEVGVHGLNAWRSAEDAGRELQAFKETCSAQQSVGIRMHWLYAREGMWKHLDEAGYAYDASYGWNDRIGFPGGHYTPFRADGTNSLMVLPLNIQDGALLGREHANLSPDRAWREVEKVLAEARRNHAVVTVLWHNTSFVAPRFWGEVYEQILRQAKSDEAEVLTAGQAVERFRDAELT
jgi:hypothetical protein